MARNGWANTVPTSLPPERGDRASEERPKGWCMTEPERKAATRVCGGPAATQVSTHLPSHALSRASRGSVTSGKARLEGHRGPDLIYLFSVKKPKGTLDIKKVRNKRSEKCSNMEAGSRSEAKTSPKPHTAITASSLPQPLSPSLLTGFVQFPVGHGLCFPTPHKGPPMPGGVSQAHL